jgi:hypothetical protein
MPNYAKVMGFSHPIEVTSMSDYDVHPFSPAVQEITDIDIPVVTVPAEVEITDITLPAQAGNIAVGDYFTIDDPITEYYVYYEIDGSTINDPLIVGKTGIKADILTADANTVVATKTALAIDGVGDFDCPAPGAAIIEVTNVNPGDVADAAAGVGVTGATYNPTQQGTDIATTIVAGDYLLLDTYTSDPDFYVWFTVDTVGTDPLVASRTGIQVDVLSSDNTAAVAIKLEAAINTGMASAGSATSTATDTTVTNAIGGAVADATTGVGLAGWGYTISQQGVDSIPGTDFGANTAGAYMVRIIGIINLPQETWQREGIGAVGNQYLGITSKPKNVDIVVNKARVESVWSL